MAPKKGIFFYNPPSVTSDKEEDGYSSEDVQHSQNPSPSTPISNPKSFTIVESDSEPEHTTPPNNKTKPLASTLRSETKRSLDNNNNNNTNVSGAKLSKKKKTVSSCGGSYENEREEDVRVTGKDSKQRVFYEEYELSNKKASFFYNSPSATSDKEDDYSSEDVQHSQNPSPSTPISNPKSFTTVESDSEPKHTTPPNNKTKPLASTLRSRTKRSLDNNNNNANGSDAKLSKKKKLFLVVVVLTRTRERKMSE
ncbi:hypothetical protein TSUD_282190 [Trifolium subterraneum]|uniref:Uncharacterized protein n=1 Tax=Trifolium subterraneum TaxID=3900 RepID=A0A2Z6MBF3_TRISU|nr:hypothetical protein TSUD_282190 [Trifolium subterraneum]